MTKIFGKALKNLPWKEKPEGCKAPVWRYEENPIIPRDPFPTANSVFNSAVVPFKDGFAGVFRVDDISRRMTLHRGFSKDGINWNIDENEIRFVGQDPDIAPFIYGYDPRVCFIEDRYYITWCNGYVGPTIGVAYTEDFETFYQLENAFLPFNRNGVLFPRKINGNYMMLSRPSDNGHTPFGDIFLSQSPDLCFWGKHRLVMQPVSPWEATKIGAGAIPIETDEGWLLIYHGVLTSCNGFVYSMGAALLDINQPWKVKARSRSYIMCPKMEYECTGDVPNVVFPCSALFDAATGRITIYYGCADTVTGMAFTTVDILINYIKENDIGIT